MVPSGSASAPSALCITRHTISAPFILGGVKESLDIALFLDREQLAAGSPSRPFHRTGRPDRVGAPSAVGPGTRDLCQSDGLEEGDNSQLEQGTLLLPPSPANGFRPLPSEHTLLTVCALRVDLFIHPLHCDARSSSPFSHLPCNVSPAAVQDQGLSAASRLQEHPP